MYRYAAWRWSPALRVGGCTAFTCAMLSLGIVCAAEAGINVWTRIGDPQFTSLAIAPGEPSALYASTSTSDDALVYKSIDRGSTWDQILDVGNPGAVIAASSSIPNSVYVVVAPYGAGSEQTDVHLLRSIDGGATWDLPDAGLHRDSNTVAAIVALVIDPFTPGTLYAETDLGVFKSTDQASTWNALNTGLLSDSETLVYQIVIDPVTSTTLYAGYIDHTELINGLPKNGVLRSTDGGATWGAADTGLPFSAFPLLAIDPGMHDTLYVGTNVVTFGVDPGEFETKVGVFKSTDAGATWSSGYGIGLPADSRLNALVVDPHMSTTLYAALYPGGVFQSEDGGTNWRPLNTGQKFTGATNLTIDPLGPTTIYASTGGGIFSMQQVAGCAGDCSGFGAVAINDLITLVNIALGTAEPAVCAGGGLPVGGEVDVAVIIEAVNNALSGCSG